MDLWCSPPANHVRADSPVHKIGSEQGSKEEFIALARLYVCVHKHMSASELIEMAQHVLCQKCSIQVRSTAPPSRADDVIGSVQDVCAKTRVWFRLHHERYGAKNFKSKRGGGVTHMRRKCLWFCGSPVATPEVHMKVFPHSTVMPTQIPVLAR